jgi:hypothetical protein
MISASLVEGMVTSIGSQPLDADLFARLRQQFDGVRLTACFEDDIYSGKPVYACEHFSIYLVGDGEHCLSLTNDYDIATGVVIAECLPEE